MNLPQPLRSQLVHAMAVDTICTLIATPSVVRVTVLSRRSGLQLPPTPSLDVLVQPATASSLDEALAWCAVTHIHASSGLAVVVADLPALKPRSMADVLQQAQHHRVAMVADTQGAGTTILTARDPSELNAHFGDGSASKHQAAGAILLPSTPDARFDVDTADDLRRATAIGLGPRTTALLETFNLAPG